MGRIAPSLVLGIVLAASPVRAQGVESNERDWLRVGDALAAATGEGSLEGALAAYTHVLEQPSDPGYALALHHTAWIYFLLDREAESIARFAQLIDRLDADGASGSLLRSEAMDLLGAMFADPDWDRDGAPDAQGTLARLSSSALIAQDRAWLPELYRETARALYLSVRDPAAIALWDHTRTRWPAPLDATLVEAACRRHRARQEAMEGALGTLPATDALCAQHAPLDP